MGFFYFTLILAVILCSLVAGFLFAFAVVVMPGIKILNDREFIRAFQVMDGVIQNNQPVFISVWVGSIVVLIISAALGFGQLHGFELFFLLIAVLTYLIGVQLPTFIVNVPLNNKLKVLDVSTMEDAELKTARNDFEHFWNRWNDIRTVLSCLTTILLLILLLKL